MRLETDPGIFRDCGDTRQRILDQIGDPVVQKLLILRWGMRGEITQERAESLIQANKLKEA